MQSISFLIFKNEYKLNKFYVRIVIFGSWGADWILALGPNSQLWVNHPTVKEIIIVPDTGLNKIPPPINADLITIVIPLMEWHIVNSPKNYLSLISNASVIKTLAIKNRFVSYMYKIGMSHLIPKCYKNINEVIFPFVLKRIDLNGGNGIAIVETLSDLNKYSERKLWFRRSVILQEYVQGDKEYVTHMVCLNGEILWHSSFLFLLVKPYLIRTPNNVRVMRRVTLSEKIIHQFRACLKPLKFSGPCNIDFKISNNGTLKILEINPRLGGTLMLRENFDLLKEAIDLIVNTTINFNEI